MRDFLAKIALVAGLVCLVCPGPILSLAAHAKDRTASAVVIVAPDQTAAKVYSDPSPRAKVVAVVAHGEVLEVMGHKGGYVEVRLPESKGKGFVLEAHTMPWQPPEKPGRSPLVPVAIAVVVLAGAVGGGFLYLRARKAREVERRASFIAASIKTAEEFFRSGDYPAAIEEFNRYLELQGGEVRNPDVYRRLSYCHLKTGHANEAARSWQKMKDLGGLRSTQDYGLGVEIMTAIGKEATAAEIYETLLRTEQDDERAYEIHKNLFTIYRRLKNPRKLLEHAIELISTGATEPEVYSDAVHVLIAEGATDLAIESNNKEIILRIGQEFLEEKVMTPEAERIYLKCLSFDRTDQWFHRALAEKYKKESNVRKAVGELTILHQLDKERPEEYIEQAAKLYVENSLISEALAEGNPKVIKKIAQIYLSRSEVTPEAVAVYERLVELQPKLVGVNKMLSTVYLTRGDLQKYMAKLRLLHELDGANHDYLTDLAKCIIDNDLIEKTLREGNQELNERILKLFVKSPLQDEKGLARLEAFLQYAPNNVTALDALAKRYQQQANHARELDMLLTLSHLRPDARGIAERAASIALEHGLLEAVLQKGHREVLLASALEIVARKLDTPIAVQILIQAAKEYPQEMRIRKYLETREKISEPTSTVPEPVQAHAPRKGPSKPTGPEAVSPPAGRTAAAASSPRKKAPTAAPKESAPMSVPTGPPVATPSPLSGHTANEQPHEEAAKGTRAAKVPPVQQSVRFIGRQESSSQQKQVTTFVSYHEKGQPRVRYDPEELFVPASGGFAYKDLDLIATDGWGLWHLAKEVNTERTVLLRVFRKDLLPSYGMDEFVEEVSRLSYNLSHDGILGIDDVVTGPGRSRGLICSYLPHTLEQVLQSKPSPDLEKMISVIGKIAAAMAFACSYRGAEGRVRRTYHLALQPSQILVSEDLSTCKVTGLGYALAYRNLMKATQPRWKAPGSNPAYMPPELFATRPGSLLERSVDVYSLGVMAYRMVSGELPFEGPDPEDYRFQHTKVFPAPPSLVNPSVPQWLEGIIMQCLEKSLEKRWNSSVELYEALRKHMRESSK